MGHDKIFKQLTQLEIGGKDLQVIIKHVMEQAAAMRVDGEISSFNKIKCGVKQGCVLLSPDLYSLYSEIIMPNLEGYPGM